MTHPLKPRNHWHQALDWFYATDAEEHHPEYVWRLMDRFLDAPKFCLQMDGGLLFDVEMDRSPFADQILTMPYPLTVIEYGFSQEFLDRMRDKDMKSKARVTKCIALIEETTVGEAQIHNNPSKETFVEGVSPKARQAFVGLPENHKVFIVYTISYLPKENRWYFNPMGACIPAQPRFNLARDAGMEKQTFLKYPEMIGICIDRQEIEKIGASVDVPFQQMAVHLAQDLSVDVMVTVDLALYLATNNAEYVRIPAPHKLNRKRARKGKAAINEYKIITLNASGPDRFTSGPQGGTHASPKLHMRSAHIRRLSSGKITTVRATMVGAKERGVVTHDYEVVRL